MQKWPISQCTDGAQWYCISMSSAGNRCLYNAISVAHGISLAAMFQQLRHAELDFDLELEWIPRPRAVDVQHKIKVTACVVGLIKDEPTHRVGAKRLGTNAQRAKQKAKKLIQAYDKKTTPPVLSQQVKEAAIEFMQIHWEEGEFGTCIFAELLGLLLPVGVHQFDEKGSCVHWQRPTKKIPAINVFVISSGGIHYWLLFRCAAQSSNCSRFPVCL